MALSYCGNIQVIDPDIYTLLNSFTGMVSYYATDNVPNGWLVCDGSTLSTATYIKLFGVIGYTWGGSGASFNIPDLRGTFIRSFAGTGSIDAGRVFASFQDHALQQHQHIINWGTRAVSSGGGSCWTNGGNDSGNVLNANTSTETRPVNYALLACIKY